MKILVDCVPLSAGGGVQVAIAFLDGLRREPDCEWRAVAPEGLAEALPADLAADRRLRLVPKAGWLDRVKAARVLRTEEAAFRPDVVFTVFGPAYFRAKAPHVVGFALPRLIYPREPRVDRGFAAGVAAADWMRGQAFRGVTHIVAETQTVRRRLAEQYRIDEARISVIGNAVNPLLRRRERADCGQDGRFVILVPSAYYPHKNLEVLPRVAAALASAAPSLDFEVRLTLDPRTASWRAIEDAARRLGVASRVRTLGVLKLDALGAAYEAASAVYLPTVREASTAVYPESFFYRRPLVTSDLDFARELCGDAAIYVPPFDVEAAARSLALLATSEVDRRRLTEAGAARLSVAYPTPQAKFAMQMRMLRQAAGT